MIEVAFIYLKTNPEYNISVIAKILCCGSQKAFGSRERLE